MARHRGAGAVPVSRPRVIHDYDAPTPSQSVEMMTDIDALPRPLRMLVYEHGAVRVGALLDSGLSRPMELRDQLRTIRALKQEELLAIEVWTPRMVERFYQDFKRGLTRMNRRRRRRRD